MAINVFLSYAHEDESHRRALEKHLAALRREGRINLWHDRRVLPGQRFDTAIDAALERADVVLLLVSADFLDSDYCFTVELERALARERDGVACVIPVIVSPCDWNRTPFAKFVAAPRDGLPVTRWPTWDDAYADVAGRVRDVVDALAAVRAPASAEAVAGAHRRAGRRLFSDSERLRFLRAAHADVLRHLEALAQAMGERAPPYAGEITRVGSDMSRCRIRHAGTLLRECVIWLVPERCCIAYASTRTPAFDEGIGVCADDQALFLCPLGATVPARCRLLPRDAAAHLWRLVTAALDRAEAGTSGRAMGDSRPA